MPSTQKVSTHDLSLIATRMRRNVIRMTSEAGSGHATSSLSAADIVTALFFGGQFRFDVQNPLNPHNDRFILSKGHAAPILYAAWAEAGAISQDHLLTLRKFDSELEGHPTPRFRWVDVATGSLGQGLPISVGDAIAAKLDGFDYRTYVLMGDGETAEGSVWEACDLASHRKLDNLIGIVDINRLGQSEPTMFQRDVDQYSRRFGAFGWHVIVVDGHDFEQLLSALDEASGVTGKPIMILARTIKGKGAPAVEDKEGWHGRALPEDYEKAALENLKLNEEVPRLRISPPANGADGSVPLKRPVVVDAPMPEPGYKLGEKVATREAYGAALAKIGKAEPRIVVFDGDVGNSTGAKKFEEVAPSRFIQGYIAEQNMIGAAVGLQSRGKLPFVASFACFLSRAFDIIRLAAVSRANLKIAGSHAGISIGEDGPSQMGLEDMAMMRSIQGSTVLYPSDGVSGERMVELAARTPGIVYIRTTRPKTPVIYSNESRFEVGGCKILRAGHDDRLTVVAAGITVHEALRAAEMLRKEGVPVRVIDLYSVKPLAKNVLVECAAQTNNTILTVEDHYAEGGLGDAVASAVGPAGVYVHQLAVRDMPRSGTKERLLEAYGIDAGAIFSAAMQLARSTAERQAGVVLQASG